MRLQSTPKADGFFMPAEFDPQERIFMLWPERRDVWHHQAVPAQKVFAEAANAISEFEEIVVGISNPDDANAKAFLNEKVRVVHIPHDDSWARDVGPTFVVDGQGGLRANDWKFNAWGGLRGGLYTSWEQDDRVAGQMCQLADVDSYRTEDFILEGGSIHVDGEGTLITTKECLLNKNRNPHLGVEEIEAYLKAHLDVEKIIWMDKGLYNDETDGHVDNICCYAHPGEVILSWTDDVESLHYEIVRDAYNVLTGTTDAKGRTIKVHKLYLPQPIYITDEEYAGIETCDSTNRSGVADPLPASYVNFLFVNGGIILPVFNDPMDAQAIQTIQAIFPERKIVPVYSREIILGGGNIHCITQQQPRR